MTERPKQGSLPILLDRSQFDSLIAALQNLTKAYACAQIRRDEGTERNARFLRVFGFTEQEIADVLGITRQAVNKALSKSK